MQRFLTSVSLLVLLFALAAVAPAPVSQPGAGPQAQSQAGLRQAWSDLGGALVQNAEAKRFGGGRSFGFSRSVPRAPRAPIGQRNTQGQQPNSGRQGGMFGRGGMGLFGGLLAGSLLGSLFFGHGFGGIGMIDLLLIGGGIYLLTRFMRSRAPSQAAGYGERYERGATGHGQSGPDHGDAWSRLRTQPAEPGGTPGPAYGPQAQAQPRVSTPEGFDSEEFLRGAKAVFVRMQEAWDRRDLEDIREFVSPQVFEEVSRQAQDDPTPSTTTILLLEAELAHAEKLGPATQAAVRYRALLQESGGPAEPDEVNEVWHFQRDGDDAPWKLIGLQQD